MSLPTHSTPTRPRLSYVPAGAGAAAPLPSSLWLDSYLANSPAITPQNQGGLLWLPFADSVWTPSRTPTQGRSQSLSQSPAASRFFPPRGPLERLRFDDVRLALVQAADEECVGLVVHDKSVCTASLGTPRVSFVVGSESAVSGTTPACDNPAPPSEGFASTFYRRSTNGFMFVRELQPKPSVRSSNAKRGRDLAGKVVVELKVSLVPGPVTVVGVDARRLEGKLPGLKVSKGGGGRKPKRSAR